MEYANHLNEYAAVPSHEAISQAVSAAQEATMKNCNAEVYKFLLSAIDLTTLSCTDSEQGVSAMARRAAEFYIDYPTLPSVASICVYPPFVETVGLAVDGTPLKITAVAGGFPSSQTFLEVGVEFGRYHAAISYMNQNLVAQTGSGITISLGFRFGE